MPRRSTAIVRCRSVLAFRNAPLAGEYFLRRAEYCLVGVAVLPLVNISGDPRDDHLSEGVTDDIITNLCRFRDLLVIARHSSFLFKDRQLTPAEIGRQLNVRYLLTGSLRRAERNIRITVQLIKAESGAALWAERYDGALGDIFALQDEVTNIIASRLAVQIDAAEQCEVDNAMGQLARELYKQHQQAGNGQRDFSSILQKLQD